jgi:hypothetical protein
MRLKEARMASLSADKKGDRLALLGLGCALLSVVGAALVLIVRPVLDAAGLLILAAGLLGLLAAALWLLEARRPAASAPAAPSRRSMGTLLPIFDREGEIRQEVSGVDQHDPTLPKSPLSIKDGEGSGVGPSIAADSLFVLPATGAARAFIAAKEGEPLSRCQDFYAADPARGVFAVTDGVSATFLPRVWASIIARAAVRAPEALREEAAFLAWLAECRAAWHTWVVNRWLPAIHAQQAARGEVPTDYSGLIHHKGAQTTIIACQVMAQADDGVQVDLAAVGDAVALHARPAGAGWELVTAFPITDPAAFGVQPGTLPTSGDPIWQARAWADLRRLTLTAQPEDVMLLATDTLAGWILRDPAGRIARLLALPDAVAYETLIAEERQSGEMNDDDMTLLIVPIERKKDARC